VVTRQGPEDHPGLLREGYPHRAMLVTDLSTPPAMTASAPTIVMAAATTSHVTVAMSVAAAGQNDRGVSAGDQRVRRDPRHGRSG
jgi:hypothetical protein